jgi:hypothetical protein
VSAPRHLESAADATRRLGYVVDSPGKKAGVPTQDPGNVERPPSGSDVVSVQPQPAWPIPEPFWEARPILTHIHAFARARRASPWAVLGIVLARVCVATPPFVVLPALVGSTVSLNTFVGLVGPSGSGKDAAARAAEDAVLLGHLDTTGVGSGEGVAHQFVVYRKPNAKTGDAGGMEQYRTALLMTAPEVDTVSALHHRQASTLLSELRKTWNGDALGYAYVDPTKRLTLARHKYRLCLVVGIQPERAGPILDSADSGTPQRFLWLPATDPEIPNIAPAEPAPWNGWKLPQWGYADAHGRVVLQVCETARLTIDANRVARLRGNGEALDGHALLCQLKVAAVLAILDGQAYVSDEDWRLAGVIAAKSERTRLGVVETLQNATRAANAARGRAEGERSVIAAETVTEHAVRRIAQLIVSKLAAGPAFGVSHSVLRRDKIHSRDRDYFDIAIDRLIGTGQVEVVHIPGSIGDGNEHRHYRLAGGHP